MHMHVILVVALYHQLHMRMLKCLGFWGEGLCMAAIDPVSMLSD